MRIIIIISLNVHSRPLIHRYDTERERERGGGVRKGVWPEFGLKG